MSFNMFLRTLQKILEMFRQMQIHFPKAHEKKYPQAIPVTDREGP
jgi:hypothetical protein